MGKHSKERRLARQGFQQPQGLPGFQITAHAAHFSGPIPPPEILIKYNEAVPGGAERIIAMAEEQSRHRQHLEKTVVEANCTTQKTGPWLGFIICMTAILGGVYLITLGKSTEGLAAIVFALTALATVFVLGRKKQDRELKQKADALLAQSKTSA